MTKRILTIEILPEAIKNFFEEVTLELKNMLNVKVDLSGEEVKLILEKKSEIKSKAEINKSNGRYYFKESWDDYIPNADSQGTYIFFDINGQAVYVGMSLDRMGNRVCAHTGKKVNGEFPDLEFSEAKYIVTIPFKACPSLSPALEHYLINKYSISGNRNYS